MSGYIKDPLQFVFNNESENYYYFRFWLDNREAKDYLSDYNCLQNEAKIGEEHLTITKTLFEDLKSYLKDLTERSQRKYRCPMNRIEEYINRRQNYFNYIKSDTIFLKKNIYNNEGEGNEPSFDTPFEERLIKSLKYFKRMFKNLKNNERYNNTLDNLIKHLESFKYKKINKELYYFVNYWKNKTKSSYLQLY